MTLLFASYKKSISAGQTEESSSTALSIASSSEQSKSLLSTSKSPDGLE